MRRPFGEFFKENLKKQGEAFEESFSSFFIIYNALKIRTSVSTLTSVELYNL